MILLQKTIVREVRKQGMVNKANFDLKYLENGTYFYNTLWIIV